MEKKVYPDMAAMCRLCLKENAGTICIFNNDESSGKRVPLSIPMRIMACASLEVQCYYGPPKKICTDCRFQLEKSYYFRKRCQASDVKIRKHLRMIEMGKGSNVFDNKLCEDDYDERELQESISFIREQEGFQQRAERLKIDSLLNEVKLQKEKDLEKIKESLKAKYREELISEIREELKEQLKMEFKNEMEDTIRKEVTDLCLSQAKESVRSEIRDECRQLEMKSLLDDLQTYLSCRIKSVENCTTTKSNALKRAVYPTTRVEQRPKVKLTPQNSIKIDVVRMEVLGNGLNTEKGNTVLAENRTDDEQNINNEECDSEGNYFFNDTPEVFDVLKASSDDELQYEDSLMPKTDFEAVEFSEESVVTYEKMNEENMEHNDESAETTSYRIEDNEDGEIKFLKKSGSNNISGSNEENSYQYKNLVLMNIEEGIDNEYLEHFEEEEKHVKKEKKSSAKTKISANKEACPSRVTRTTSLTSEKTILTKTYVNPMQRCSDTPKMFKCDDCPMVFSTKLSLERHLRTHRKIEKTGVTYQCPECRIVVSCSSALRRHMYVHCKEKPFACTVCDKAFVQKEILKRHMQTHTGIKPHQCSHCGRSFAQRINLTQHINRTHLEEPRIRLHPCYLCPKRFNHASGLSRHLASHSGIAFQCSECSRTFGDRSSIRRHIANMHPNSSTSKDVETS